MTIQELLIPRYKVIADFPSNERYSHFIGDIFTDDGRTAVLNQKGLPVFAVEWDKYPHIYRKMQWWEERLDNEIPKYVKHEKFGVRKVADKSQDYRHLHVEGEIEHRFAKTGWGEPATEEEYNQQINFEIKVK